MRIQFQNSGQAAFLALLLLLAVGGLEMIFDGSFSLFGEKEHGFFSPGLRAEELHNSYQESAARSKSPDDCGKQLTYEEQDFHKMKPVRSIISVDREGGSEQTVVTIDHGLLCQRGMEFLDKSWEFLVGSAKFAESSSALFLTYFYELWVHIDSNLWPWARSVFESYAILPLRTSWKSVAEWRKEVSLQAKVVQSNSQLNRFVSAAKGSAERCSLLANDHFMKSMESTRNMAQIVSSITMLVENLESVTFNEDVVALLACAIISFSLGFCARFLKRSNGRGEESGGSSDNISCFYSVKSS